jgi:hypothetical protein
MGTVGRIANPSYQTATPAGDTLPTGLPLLIGQELTVHDDDHTVSLGILLLAEDQAEVIVGSELLLTREWSRLNRGEVEHKYYVKDVGLVVCVLVKGGLEWSQLEWSQLVEIITE